MAGAAPESDAADVVVTGGPGSPDHHDGAAPPDPGLEEVEEYVDRETYTDMLLHSYLPHCIHGFKHDIVELVETFLTPKRRQLARDWTRQVTPDRADDMARLLFVGLDDAEPPEQQQHDAADGGQSEAPPVISAAGFVDRLHIRMLVQAFFHPDLVDVGDEGKDTRGDRSFMANFMAATGFVNRLWDVRRMVAVCRDGGLEDGERRATVAGMLHRLEELLDDRARAVRLGTFKIIN
ncbi:hypothetical protein E2562_007868 [Oryza meyeriana var. granulata]|uniref:Uncharacterized protein n=1 Tax=Oryza meyeriana var. granulata TaxID=110450 RepID=A0A6G1F5F6_9ORYZ|nr:hypothetical protein E2562_007868 [Oryza meyeriana var. granulata]